MTKLTLGKAVCLCYLRKVLECEDAMLNATAFSILADAKIGIAGDKRDDKRSKSLKLGLDFLDRAFMGLFCGLNSCVSLLTGLEFKKVSDRKSQAQIMSKKARVLDLLGERVLRDDAVQVWRGLRGADTASPRTDKFVP